MLQVEECVNRRRARRLAAEALIALPTLVLLDNYMRARAADQWNYQANLYQAMVIGSIGLVGWWLPRLAAWILLPLGTLVALGGLLLVGLPGLILGAIPAAAGYFFLRSAHPLKSADKTSDAKGNADLARSDYWPHG